MSLSSLKITSRTLFKVKIQNKIRCAQFGKIKGMTWQKDAFSDDAWRCRVSQMQWRKVYQARGAAMKNARSPITNRRWYSQTSVNCTMHISCNRRPPVLKTKEEKVTVHSTLPHRVTASTNRSSTGAVYWSLLTEYTEFIAYFWHYKLTCPNNLHFQNYIRYSSVEMLTHANRRYYWPVLMSTECDRRNSQPVDNVHRPLCWQNLRYDAKVEKAGAAGQLFIAVTLWPWPMIFDLQNEWRRRGHQQ